MVSARTNNSLESFPAHDVVHAERTPGAEQRVADTVQSSPNCLTNSTPSKGKFEKAIRLRMASKNEDFQTLTDRQSGCHGATEGIPPTHSSATSSSIHQFSPSIMQLKRGQRQLKSVADQVDCSHQVRRATRTNHLHANNHLDAGAALAAAD